MFRFWMKFEMQSRVNMLIFCVLHAHKKHKIGFFVNVTEEAVQNMAVMIIIVLSIHMLR